MRNTRGVSIPEANPQGSPLPSGSPLPWPPPVATQALSPPPTAPAVVIAPAVRRAGHRVAVLALSAAVVAGLIGGLIGSRAAVGVDAATPRTPTSLAFPTATNGLSAGSIGSIAVAVRPAVVSIHDASGARDTEGSGFVVSPSGYVVTNDHVVAELGSAVIDVAFADGSERTATVVGRSGAYDLAVLKVSGTDLPTVVLGDSATVLVGDTAVAIGSPLGLEGTVTAGIISAVNRSVSTGGSGETAFLRVLQTDAPINPGNSGGPLVNARGEVVGVNSSAASLDGTTDQAGSIGLGFAIPVNQVRRVVQEIIATGHAATPVLGISVDTTATGPGAELQSVTQGGPADNAGLAAGDTVVEIDGDRVADATEFIATIRALAPGGSMVLTVESGGVTHQVTVTLGSEKTGP